MSNWHSFFPCRIEYPPESGKHFFQYQVGRTSKFSPNILLSSEKDTSLMSEHNPRIRFLFFPALLLVYAKSLQDNPENHR